MRRTRMTVNKNINRNKSISLKGVKKYILGGVCAILAVFSIFLTIEAATSGAEVADLQNKESILLAEQEDLKESLVETLSVNSLEEKSVELGFTKVEKLVYVTDGEGIIGNLSAAQMP